MQGPKLCYTIRCVCARGCDCCSVPLGDVMPAQLVALTEGPSILLDKPILLVGRHPECDIQINSRKISRMHCCIAQVSQYLVVRDLGSTNGIRINGVRVNEGQLHPGDELTIGSSRYNVQWEGANGHGADLRGRPSIPQAPLPGYYPSGPLSAVPLEHDPVLRPVSTRPAPPRMMPAASPNYGIAAAHEEDDLDSFDDPVPIRESREPMSQPMPVQAVRPAVAQPVPLPPSNRPAPAQGLRPAPLPPPLVPLPPSVAPAPAAQKDLAPSTARPNFAMPAPYAPAAAHPARPSAPPVVQQPPRPTAPPVSPLITQKPGPAFDELSSIPPTAPTLPPPPLVVPEPPKVVVPKPPPVVSAPPPKVVAPAPLPVSPPGPVRITAPAPPPVVAPAPPRVVAPAPPPIVPAPAAVAPAPVKAKPPAVAPPPVQPPAKAPPGPVDNSIFSMILPEHLELVALIEEARRDQKK